jgi:hypothetical protein
MDIYHQPKINGFILHLQRVFAIILSLIFKRRKYQENDSDLLIYLKAFYIQACGDILISL